MTDNTQELDEVLDGLHETGCSVIEGMDYPRSVAAGMYTCDCSALDAKQDILDWHNKQIEAVLDRVEKEVIGDEILSDFDHDAGFCQNCDFQPTDGTENCICKIINMARFKQRQSLATLLKELDGGQR